MGESQFIKVYSEVLEKSLCNDIINLYEKLWKEQTDYIKQMSLCYDTKGNKTCGACDCQRLDIMQHEEFQPIINNVVNYLQQLINFYKEDCNIHSVQWPKKYGFENIRVKRYMPDGIQQHDAHVDVENKGSAKRFLSIICYLNDDFEGGETSFPHFNTRTKVGTGTVLLFPCSWSYLHKGNPISSGNPKYVLGTFLNYVDSQKLNRIGDKTLGTKGI